MYIAINKDFANPKELAGFVYEKGELRAVYVENSSFYIVAAKYCEVVEKIESTDKPSFTNFKYRLEACFTSFSNYDCLGISKNLSDILLISEVKTLSSRIEEEFKLNFEIDEVLEILDGNSFDEFANHVYTYY